MEQRVIALLRIGHGPILQFFSIPLWQCRSGIFYLVVTAYIDAFEPKLFCLSDALPTLVTGLIIG